MAIDVIQGFLKTGIKEQCLGCEACAQICPKNAILMIEDEEGFCYPKVNLDLCVSCGLCNKVCPIENHPLKKNEEQLAYGGYHKKKEIQIDSTSGGAFSALVDSWCDDNYVIFGAKADDLNVYHSYIEDKKDIGIFRKSKYSQSAIGNSFIQAKKFLDEGKKVLFSGTPCQIAGLNNFLNNKNYENLLTIEVICEGVPSPLFIRKMNEWYFDKNNSYIKSLDYRFTDKNRWDFEVMRIELNNGEVIKKDRWFNQYWAIWLDHLMSRPSCYHCPFTTKERLADITLGDLWGVHIYCPDLYSENRGASLIICNTEKGNKVLNQASENLMFRQLDINEAIKYQSPLRNPIQMNSKRKDFISDLNNQEIDYKQICKKWGKPITIKTLLSKYVWGNRQKVKVWNIKSNKRRK